VRVEVDQSGKIEDTRIDTVLAFSNDICHAILIPAKVKRACIHVLRTRGRGGPTLYPRLFSTALFLLLKGHWQVLELVIVDVEYQSKDRQIKQHLLNLLRRAGLNADGGRVIFRRVGKRSSAHRVAIQTLRGHRIPNREVQMEELLAQL